MLNNIFLLLNYAYVEIIDMIQLVLNSYIIIYNLSILLREKLNIKAIDMKDLGFD